MACDRNVVSLVARRFARPRMARWNGTATLAALLAVGIFPIGEILLRPLEVEFPPREAPAHIYGFIVLGGVEDQRATASATQAQPSQYGDYAMSDPSMDGQLG